MSEHSQPDSAPDLTRSLASNPPHRILIVARDHLGDLVNTTGAVASIVARFPGAHIAIEAGEGAITIFEGFPGVDELRPRPARQGLGGKARYVQGLKAGKFDLAIILDDSNEKVLLASMAGIGQIVGVRKSKHFKRFTASVPFDPVGHDLFDSLRGVLSLIGASQDVRPRLPQLPTGGHNGESAVLLSISASLSEKRWPLDSFVELAKILQTMDLRVVAVAGPGEAGLLEKLNQQGIETAHPPSSPLDLAGLIKSAKLLVTTDSGPAHVAAAVDTPAIVLFGPTPSSRFAPYPGRQRLIHNGFACDMYRDRCAAKASGSPCDLRCMTSITVEQVAAAVLELLKEVANCE